MPQTTAGKICPPPGTVGRRPQIAALARRLAAVAAGTGGCVVLEGPVGIGKSHLLGVAGREASAAGLTVAAGRATEFDRITPLGALLRALGAADPPIADATVAGRAAGPDADRWHLLDRLGALIEERAARAGLVVIVDDVHGVDELTALALRMLVPALRSSPVLWLLARRPHGGGPTAREAVDWLLAGHAEALPVPPLDGAEVAEFCRRVRAAPPDEPTLALARSAGGNPFLLHHLLTTVGEPAVAADPAGETGGSLLPAPFLQVVDRCLGELPPAARRLLDVGAVLGRPFTLHEAAGLAGIPVVALLTAADAARTAGVLADTGAELSFTQDIVRQAVYQQLSGPARHALHREAALVLRREGRPAAEAVEHLVRSARRGDHQAAALIRQAAAELAPRAPGTAGDLLIRALALFGDGDPAYEETAADAVRLLAAAGRLDDARRIGDAALRHGLAPAAEAALRLGLAEALKHAGADAAVVEQTGAVLDIPGVPESARAHLQAVRAHALLYVDDLEAADRAGAEAARLGAACAEPAAVVFGLAARSVVAQAAGDLDRSVAVAREAADLADAVGGEARRRHPALWLARALTAADRFGEADALLELGQREADQLGTAWSQPLWHYYRAQLRLAAGRFDDAEAEAEAGYEVTERLAARALTVPLLGIRAELALGRDDLPAAQELLRRAGAQLAAGVGALPEDLARVTALVCEAAGDPAGALRSLAPVYANLPRRLLLPAHNPWSAVHLVRLALGQGAPGLARVAAEAARRLAEGNPRVPTAVAAADHADGLLAGDPERLVSALAGYRAGPRPLPLASALEDVAAAELRRGARAEARARLDEALAIYERCGARRDHARVRRRLREAGARRRPAPTAAKSGWAGLTEAELRVVRLVAQGLSNRATAERLFLSPHTVDTHLRHAFAKLGLSSRVELTRQVLAHDRERIT